MAGERNPVLLTERALRSLDSQNYGLARELLVAAKEEFRQQTLVTPSARHHDIPAPPTEELQQADSRFLEATDRLNAENAALKARLALLEKKAGLADRGRFTLGGVARGARLLLREQDEAIAWCADYDALEASR